jgi:type II secretory pathway pseudopilin PulG
MKILTIYRGFGLIETIIYIALLSFIITVLMQFIFGIEIENINIHKQIDAQYQK